MATVDLIFSKTYWIKQDDPHFLYSYFNILLLESGFTILKFTEHHFKPHGYTCLWLLAESHLSLHSFPEYEKTFIQVASCNQEKFELFDVEIVKSPLIGILFESHKLFY